MSWNKFAHLFGGPKAKAEDDEEDKKARRAEEEEDKKEDQEGEASDDEEDTKSKKSRKADDEEDDTSAEDDDSGDEDEEDEGKQDVKKGRKAESKRCAAIFASAYAANNTALAAHLAFETRMSASEAINTMKLASSSQPKSRLDQRMSSVTQHKLGQDSSPKKMGTAQQMMSVYNRFNKKGEK